MIAEPAPDDQHAVIAKGRKQTADFKVHRRIQVFVEGQLDDRNILVWIERFHDAESTVIKTAAGVQFGINAAALKKLLNTLRKSGRTGRLVFDVVKIVGEAKIIIDHSGPCA